MTLVALTTQNRRHLSEHAGRCRKFTLARMYGGRLQGELRLVEIDMSEALHSTHRLPQALDGVEVLITRGAGPGLAARLQAQGTQVLVTDQTDPMMALQAWAEGTLKACGEPAEDKRRHRHAQHPHGKCGSHGDGGSCGCHDHTSTDACHGQSVCRSATNG